MRIVGADVHTIAIAIAIAMAIVAIQYHTIPVHAMQSVVHMVALKYLYSDYFKAKAYARREPGLKFRDSRGSHKILREPGPTGLQALQKP